MKNKITKLEEVLKKEGFLIYPIKGTSMLPLLVEKEDTVKILPLTSDAKINDVVLYKGTNNFILHRVIGINKKTYNIVGDNNNNLEIVNKKDVVGVMVGYFKKKRYVSVEAPEYLDYVNNHIIGVDYKTRKKLYPTVPNEWKYIFNSIKDVIGENVEKQENHEDYDNLNYKSILNLCKRHSISAIIFTKLDKNLVPKEIYDEFNMIANSNIRKTIMFEAERNRILKIFSDNNIDYVNLKGIITNTLYPKMGMREFADNDILIRDKDSKKIYELMTKDKYEPATLRGVHDSYHKSPFYNFEFHRRLFDSKKDYNGFFNNIWSKVIHKENNEYVMSEEDFYLYNLAHFYKHYSKGGLGIRNFIDLYLIRKRLNSLDNINYDYINASLKKAKLDTFEKEMLALADKMFVLNKDLSYKDIVYIMESGTYGLLQNDVKNSLNKTHGNKLKYFLSRMFIPYRSMKTMFPILVYLPFLLPIFWVVRWFKPLFNKKSREHLKCELDVIKEYNKD